MADKHLYVVGGETKEREAKTSSAGAADAGKHVALNGAGKIDLTMLPDGLGDDITAYTASEDLAAGDFVNIWDDAGTPKVRKADASNGRRADAFVKDAALSGASVAVYFDGTNNDQSGLTPGTTYFLSGTTPGAATATAPSASGHIVQEVGRSRSATEISFQPSTPITLA